MIELVFVEEDRNLGRFSIKLYKEKFRTKIELKWKKLSCCDFNSKLQIREITDIYTG